MKPNQKRNQQTGKIGESIAGRYLQQKGYSIIETNFKTRYPEIDIIASKNNNLIFIEVKTRKSNLFGAGEESITPQKLNHLTYAVNYYLLKHKTNKSSIRLDLISIILSSQNKLLKLTHYQNISH